MRAPSLGTVTVGGFDLQPLSDHEWRVTDRELAASGGLGVVGFIEVIGDEFEVTQLGAPLERVLFSSVQAATEFLVQPH